MALVDKFTDKLSEENKGRGLRGNCPTASRQSPKLMSSLQWFFSGMVKNGSITPVVNDGISTVVATAKDDY